jgi:PPK2 family polyphosphate:nucleotide phosphotransferase
MAKLKLLSADPSDTGKFSCKDDSQDEMQALKSKLYDLLYLMYAHQRYSLLIILQGIDASGKDGVVRHIFSCVNPQGVKIFSFKKPTEEELRHDFLWRCHLHTPESGLTSIFNRSYYEEVSTVRVHPEFLKMQNLPDEILKNEDFFERRYTHINNFEKMLTDRGTLVLKFFLHISKDEQKERLQDRLREGKRNWKFSPDDIQERKYWNDYMKAYSMMIDKTNSAHAPWHIIPANNKWYRDFLISEILVDALCNLKMSFPKSKIKPSAIK